MKKMKPKSTARDERLVFTDEEFLAMERQIDRERKEVVDYLNNLAESLQSEDAAEAQEEGDT